MRAFPVNDLNKCSVKGCTTPSEVIIRKTMGEVVVMYGYCRFHSVISATYFPVRDNKEEIHI